MSVWFNNNWDDVDADVFEFTLVIFNIPIFEVWAYPQTKMVGIAVFGFSVEWRKP